MQFQGRAFSVCPVDPSVDDGFSHSIADQLYGVAGEEEVEVESEVVAHPFRHSLLLSEELAISKAAKDLNIPFVLDAFQVQSIVGLLNGRNVVLVAPCGSGKLLVFQVAVHLLRKKHNMCSGVGVCLQPLNSILFEKTNSNPPIKTAFLTMTGEAMKENNV